MKTTFKYILVVFAAFAALVSCQKENFTDNTDDKPAVGNVRVIEVHFGAETKTTLGGDEGRTPLFSDGDTIMVSNGTQKEVDTVKVKDGVATFATSLTGALTAVYPSDAAKMNGNAIEGVKVSATQDGTFAKANIAKATIASNANDATFENQTSLLRFYVDSTIGVKSITITAVGEANIADGSKTITIDPEGDVTLDKVTDDQGKRICYVAVLPGEFTSLKFTSVTTTQTMYKNNTVERIAGNVPLDTNKIYNAFIPYYIDLGAAGKWGYCNVGAFLPEDAGMYFAWGETTGHRPETDGKGAFTFGEGNGGFAKGFTNCPYSKGLYSAEEPIFTKYMLEGFEIPHWGGDTENPDNLTQLESCDDAATAIWGNGWRMPKATEFKALIEMYPNELTDFDSGYWFGTLFLPAAGNGANTDLEDLGNYGMYWSSSLLIESPGNANNLAFSDDTYKMVPVTDGEARYVGGSIRPFVSATANMPNPTETEPEVTVF